MKTIFLLLGVFATAYCLPFSADPEYAMVPDIDGTFKLINVNENLEPETFFNPHEDIIFTLFTNNGPAAGEVISWNSPSSILASSFNPANPTRITVHGWNGGPGARVNTATRNSLFQVGQFNQITVDWSAGAGTLNYIAARNRVGGVGAVVGDLIRLLVSTTGADTRQMSVIGHSLGTHVAGFAGKSLGTGNFRLGSIVALDAALPLFSINNPAERVADTDADYVESIHTNAGLLGFDQPIGHANFYPNMGVSQPGCGIDLSGNCAHARSHEFYAESISSPVGFWGRPCGGWDNISNGECIHNGGTYERMGGEPVQENNPRGVFWFETNAEAPFAQGR